MTRERSTVGVFGDPGSAGHSKSWVTSSRTSTVDCFPACEFKAVT